MMYNKSKIYTETKYCFLIEGKEISSNKFKKVILNSDILFKWTLKSLYNIIKAYSHWIN